MIHLSVNYSLGYWRSFLAKTWPLARSNCMGPFLQHTPVFLLVWWRTSPATRHKQSSFCLPLYPQPLVQSIYFSFLTFQLLLNVLVWSCVVESQRCSARKENYISFHDLFHAAGEWFQFNPRLTLAQRECSCLIRSRGHGSSRVTKRGPKIF